ncbi:X-ray radiation resistance-associated protein 1 [Xyrichtys novacula]|uniref:X-ray radiation resistance-associated protein 1 n=1 Tax=Xyrichtys novacula TaxID=13765 RepID=A0AAV1FU54_XYRNO|nr:X-ray radiation resistance-associated protein 1 [Xyrichtys novacula]
MNLPSHELTNRQNYPTKCFPARTLQHRGKEGPGHWLVAYRQTEERRYRSLHRRVKETLRKSDKKGHGNTLDAPFLLRSHCVDKPSELYSVDVSEQNLNSVKPEELKEFINVAYIDASINSLSLDSFRSFVSLRKLSLAVNGLCNLTFDADDFPQLEVLDLSYNNLSADVFVSVGLLPSLKVLHLTGNQLHRLPTNPGFSHLNTTQLPAPEEDTWFRALEVLILDDNKLSSAVFSSLKNLRRLRSLNLQRNRITEVPYLQLPGSLKPLIGKESDEEIFSLTESNPNIDEHIRKISESPQAVHQEELCGESSLPLPALQYLNLADNNIAEEDALMAAALFPSLRVINICSNPLTTRRRELPLLTYYLIERLGITIKRKEYQEAVMMPMKMSTDLKWKVEEKSSKVTKKSKQRDEPYSAQTQAGKKERTDEKTPELSQEIPNGFFVTQTTDFPRLEFFDGKETAEKRKMVDIPEEYVLMNAKANTGVEAIGIQTAVRMLDYTPKNLNVYRDSKPKLDSFQTPYREREKRIKKLPPVKLTKRPTEKLDELIKAIKESSSIRQVPLSSAINSPSLTKQDHKEIQSLLRDMKTKYKMVHKKAMDQIASIQAERDTDQNRAEFPPLNSNSIPSA